MWDRDYKRLTHTGTPVPEETWSVTSSVLLDECPNKTLNVIFYIRLQNRITNCFTFVIFSVDTNISKFSTVTLDHLSKEIV